MAATLPACLQCVQSELSTTGVTAKPKHTMHLPKHTMHLPTALKTLKFTVQAHHLLDRSSIHPSVRPLVMVPKLRHQILFFQNRYGRPKLDFVTHFYLGIWFKLSK
jgi:hypothetical protein